MISIRTLIMSVSCLFCVLTVVDMVPTLIDNSLNQSTNLATNKTFMYFAYGSNLLTERILDQNPTSKRRTIGKLQNYRLDFNSLSLNWNGPPATIVEDRGHDVWGAIWEIDVSNMADLDRQEGVDRNKYKVLWKRIKTPTGEQVTCRLYQQVNNPHKKLRFEDLPYDRQPSRTYLNCIIKGAEESRLPIRYIKELKRIPHNRRNASNPEYRKLCE